MVATSCNDFLDKLPDDRTVVDSEEKVNNLIASALPVQSPLFVLETSSDNVLDNGRQYGWTDMQNEAYRWQDIQNTSGNDTPRRVWNSCYYAVGTANEALQAIDEMGRDGLMAQRAEALICRAYSMFTLANTFCMAYDPTKASTYLGLPYPLKPETDINATHSRGTLEELYAQINADIEEALPNMNDSHLAGKAIKYHFNRTAAYAFAARFNLYYQKWEKAKEYATVALGNDASAALRDLGAVSTLALEDYYNAYINSSQKCNFMLLTAYSLAGRYFGPSSLGNRFNHNDVLCNYETIWPAMPWGSGSRNTTLYMASKLYGSNQAIEYPKMWEKFEVTDKINQTGLPHIIDVIFTGDETLLVRAEANILLKNYDAAVADLNLYQRAHCKPAVKDLTVDIINTFMDGIATSKVLPDANKERTIKKELKPQGFTLETGTQTNMVQFVLHIRRLETLFQGLRFQDIKRYGITYSHNLDGEDPLTFEPGDLRGAIQLPADVVNAGLEANPR